MGPAMTTDADDMMKIWLNKVQATDLGDREVMNPARNSQTAGEVIKGAGGGMVFDTEPAAYYKLLRDLKKSQSNG